MSVQELPWRVSGEVKTSFVGPVSVVGSLFSAMWEVVVDVVVVAVVVAVVVPTTNFKSLCRSLGATGLFVVSHEQLEGGKGSLPLYLTGREDGSGCLPFSLTGRAC